MRRAIHLQKEKKSWWILPNPPTSTHSRLSSIYRQKTKQLNTFYLHTQEQNRVVDELKGKQVISAIYFYQLIPEYFVSEW